MNGFSAKAEELLASGQSFIYCFIIRFESGENLRLTNTDYDIKTAQGIFKCKYGAQLESLSLNNLAQDSAILTLINEQNELVNIGPLDSASIEILLYFPGELLESYITMYVTKMIINGDIITLHLTSIARKLMQTMLPVYSKNCRAIFGDDKCKVDISKYSYDVILACAEGDKLIINHVPQEKGNLGYLSIPAASLKCKIKSILYDGQIILDESRDVIQNLVSYLPASAHLSPICDKKLATCSDRYDNAVNFRGEPFMPNRDQFKL